MDIDENILRPLEQTQNYNIVLEIRADNEL